MTEEALERLTDIYNAYWSGAYRDDEVAATLEEVMMLVAYIVRGSVS